MSLLVIKLQPFITNNILVGEEKEKVFSVISLLLTSKDALSLLLCNREELLETKGSSCCFRLEQVQ